MNNSIQTIVGRLGKDPVKYDRNTKKGVCPVAKFSLACEVFGKDGTQVVWYQCSAWDKRSEIVMKHLKKGDAVQLHGFASRESYVDKKNQTQNVLAFNIMYVTFLGKAKANQGQAVAAGQAANEPLPGITTTENPF